MVISVDDRLEGLYYELMNRGYEVSRLTEHKVSDVVIYSGRNTGLSALAMGGIPSNSGGAFLINGDNLSGAEIEGMIRDKTYSSIF